MKIALTLLVLEGIFCVLWIECNDDKFPGLSATLKTGMLVCAGAGIVVLLCEVWG